VQRISVVKFVVNSGGSGVSGCWRIDVRAGVDDVHGYENSQIFN